MTSSIGQRIGQIIEHSNKSVNQFARDLNYRPDKFYNVIKGKSNPSWEMIESIVKTYPEIDGNWLLKNIGSMLPQAEEEQPIITSHSPSSTLPEKAEEITKMDLLYQIIADKQKMITLLEKQVTLLEKSAANQYK
jgi:hypothetical protein